MAVRPAAYRFTVDDYHRMGEAGVIPPDARVELVEGEVVEMAPIGSRHAACVTRLSELFTEKLRRGAVVWVQNPLRLGQHSELQPDVMLLRPRQDYYATAHPGPADVLLVVEVSDTTAGWDRRRKLPLYAAAGIAEAWLVDVGARRVEACSAPGPGGYATVRVVEASEALAPTAFPDTTVEVAHLLP